MNIGLDRRSASVPGDPAPRARVAGAGASSAAVPAAAGTDRPLPVIADRFSARPAEAPAAAPASRDEVLSGLVHARSARRPATAQPPLPDEDAEPFDHMDSWPHAIRS